MLFVNPTIQFCLHSLPSNVQVLYPVCIRMWTNHFAVPKIEAIHIYDANKQLIDKQFFGLSELNGMSLQYPNIAKLTPDLVEVLQKAGHVYYTNTFSSSKK